MTYEGQEDGRENRGLVSAVYDTKRTRRKALRVELYIPTLCKSSSSLPPYVSTYARKREGERERTDCETTFHSIPSSN